MQWAEKYNDVVELRWGKLPCYRWQHDAHQPLQRFRGFLPSRRQLYKSVQSMMGCKRFFSWSRSSTSTWQYSLLEPRVKNTDVSSRKLLQSFIRSMEYKSCLVMGFRVWYLPQRNKDLSLFGANTISAAHSIWAGLLTFCKSILSVSDFSTYLAVDSIR